VLLRLLSVGPEVRRARSLKCASCGRAGAALGCRVPSCCKCFHLPCAIQQGCQFNFQLYLMACPDHAALFNNETAPTGQLLVTGQSRYDQSTQLQPYFCHSRFCWLVKLSLCGCAGTFSSYVRGSAHLAFLLQQCTVQAQQHPAGPLPPPQDNVLEVLPEGLQKSCWFDVQPLLLRKDADLHQCPAAMAADAPGAADADI